MLLGIALLGVVTASIAAWFVRVAAAADEVAVEPLEHKVAQLEAKVDELLELARRPRPGHEDAGRPSAEERP
jgi:hypothetical protein